MTNMEVSSMTNAERSKKAAQSFRANRIIKRAFDVVLSFAAIIILSLPMLIIALAVAIDAKSNPIFRQERVGQYGLSFEIYKFRTMKKSAPKDIPTAKLNNPESYITSVGKFLRATSLDELPQLFNVLRGDMSIVGPRPLICSERDIHRLREEAGVYRFRPGLTGWAQINGRDKINEAEKVRLDSEYVHSFTLKKDLLIILKTIPAVLKKEGYVEGAKR